MSRPRLLIPLTSHFVVRYLLRTGLLERLSSVAVPVVAAAWRDDELDAELAELGVEVCDLPPTEMATDYLRVRRMLDTGFRHRLASPSALIDRRREGLFLPASVRYIRAVRELRNRALVLTPGLYGRMLEKERLLVASGTNIAAFDSFVANSGAELLLSVTPFHRQEELVLRAAKRAELPMLAALHSFDNITTRGWMSVTFDQYGVWNDRNRAELRRGYREVSDTDVTITGAPQFDLYHQRKFVLAEDEWRRLVGIERDRPILLYGGGPMTIAPGEPQYLRCLDDAVSKAALPQGLVILFRRHPADSRDRWVSVLASARNVVVDEPWETRDRSRYGTIRTADLVRLASSLAHCQVHVNVSSTMTLDGAAFDRPQVGPAYDLRGQRWDRACRDLYEREHFLPITRSGGLAVARSPTELVDAVRDGLARPEAGKQSRRVMLEQAITFLDGRATERVADMVAAFISGRSPTDA